MCEKCVPHQVRESSRLGRDGTVFPVTEVLFGGAVAGFVYADPESGYLEGAVQRDDGWWRVLNVQFRPDQHAVMSLIGMIIRAKQRVVTVTAKVTGLVDDLPVTA